MNGKEIGEREDDDRWSISKLGVAARRGSRHNRIAKPLTPIISPLPRPVRTVFEAVPRGDEHGVSRTPWPRRRNIEGT